MERRGRAATHVKDVRPRMSALVRPCQCHCTGLLTQCIRYGASNPAIDMLNIMPGAVITENTGFLANTPFAVSADQFCDGIFRLMGGNWRGATCAYWGHELSTVLIGFAPWLKPTILQKVGQLISLELSKH